jgi:hypothetical protein
MAALLAAGIWQTARAAEIKLTNVGAVEDSKHVKLTFTFSEPVKPDVTYFYTHNYVGLRATGLQFSSNQLKREVPPPSEDAARTYRAVRFVQDKESGEIRLYLTKPLTPADAQVVPYDTYTEVTLLKPIGQSKPMTPVTQEQPAPTPADVPTTNSASSASVPEAPSTGDSETPPSLRSGEPGPYTTSAEPAQSEAVQQEPQTPESEPTAQPAGDEPAEPRPQTITPQAPQRIGGPSYKDFDLDKVAVNQLVFKGKPFREALMELVSDSGYNVVVADDVDNSEVTLNFAQKQLSLKSALDLLAQAFDLAWSIEPDAIVVKAKQQP